MNTTETETYQKIIDSAEQIFAVKGYDGASIREITALAGVNLAAIHYHFGSKEQLLHIVLNRKLEWLNKLY